jgi:PHD/YefM family antitoxin component YafN of YafNO toxin-antitoxin module
MLAGDHPKEVPMSKFKERYVTDEKGNRVGVLLNIEDYHKLLEELEELESLRAYDAVIASSNEVISFEQAIAEIAQDHG